jgi:hypothetical protein
MAIHKSKKSINRSRKSKKSIRKSKKSIRKSKKSIHRSYKSKKLVKCSKIEKNANKAKRITKVNMSNMSSEYGKMSTVYRSEKSYNGYSLDVLKSALQKYIRRCDHEKAIYAGVELDLFYKMKDRGEGIRTNLIHRLMIIYMEDVADTYDPFLWEFIDKHVFNLLSLRKNRISSDDVETVDKIREQEMDLLTKIIYVLANATHSRENSYYKYCLFGYLKSDLHNAYINDKFPSLKNVRDMLSLSFSPSFLPSAIKKEKNITPIVTQFLGALEQQHDIVIYYAHLIAELEKSPVSTKFYRSSKPVFLIFYLMDEFFTRIGNQRFKKLVEIGVKWYKELSPIAEDFLAWQHILLLWLKEEEKNIKNERIEIDTNLTTLYEINLSNTELKFDEWVFDMHTKIGKINGKDKAYFALESSNVCNEVKTVNKLYKYVYLYKKMLDDKYVDYKGYVFKDYDDKGEEKKEKSEEKKEEKNKKTAGRKKVKKEITRESELGRFLIRAQLVTGNAKTDTYYVEDENNNILFVKGPLDADPENLALFLNVQKSKEALGLPSLSYQILYLIPDQFGDTPLGLRNRINRNKPHPFIVCDALFDEVDIPMRIHSSKLWPPTELVDFDQVTSFSHFDFKKMKKDDEATKTLVKTLLFRYVFGLGDIAPRNFIVKGENFYSIDEDIIDKDFDFEINLKRVKGLFELFQTYISTHRVEIDKFLQKMSTLDLTEGMRRRLEKYL